MPCHNNVLYLIVQFLETNGLYASSLALQQESGVDPSWLRGVSHEVALLRRWVFAGDVKRARALLLPLATVDFVSEELKTALSALNELDMVMKSELQDSMHSRLAQAKLNCFRKLVPLFRGPFSMEESDVQNYVAMPKDQLLGLIDDAIRLHRQKGENAAQNCITVACNSYDKVTVGREQEVSDILLIDTPHDVVASEENSIVSVGHSAEWMTLLKKQHNPIALSIQLSTSQWQGVGGYIDGEDTKNEMSTADVAVSCEIDVKEVQDAAVNCGLNVKELIDVGVSCRLESKTVDAAVNCESIEWKSEAIQTESVQVINKDENQVLGRTEEMSNHQTQRGPIIIAGVHVDEEEYGRVNFENHGNQRDTNFQRLQSSNMSIKNVTTSETNISHCDADVTMPLEMNQFESSQMFVEKDPLLKNDNWSNLHRTFSVEANYHVEDSNLRRIPKCYDELTLDHVVCAEVVAEVKEPQAVRALDVHPSGSHLAVGTNARALRIFTLSSPLHHHQFSWSPSRNMILPLLPVALERHKYHDSGIYCLAYNPHLIGQMSATSMIASGAADGSAKVLILNHTAFVQNTNQEIWVQRGDNNGYLGKTRALHFSSPHLLWITATADRRLCCWDIRRTHKNEKSGLVQTLDGHVGEIQAIAMPHPETSASTSTLLLSAALDRTVRLWDTRSRRCERLVTSEAHAAFSLHFHPKNDKLIVSGHQDGSVALWDLRATARDALQRMIPHQDECRSVRWSPGGQWLLSAAFDGTLCVTQASRSLLQPLASYHKHYGKVLQAQWHPNEPAFVSSGADKRVKLWTFG
ncbi:putative WD repeat-containing protein [Plasmopara halstedii]